MRLITFPIAACSVLNGLGLDEVPVLVVGLVAACVLVLVDVVDGLVADAVDVGIVPAG